MANNLVKQEVVDFYTSKLGPILPRDILYFTKYVTTDIETIPDEELMEKNDWEGYRARQADKGRIVKETEAGLYPEFSRVICISFHKIVSNETVSVCCENEGMILDAVLHFAERGFYFIGHNLLGFDIPYLLSKHLQLGRHVHPSLRLYGQKPWDVLHIDSMKIYSHGTYRASSLDHVSKLIGVDSPKADCNGLDVARMWKAKEYGNIKKYCNGDVLATSLAVLRAKQVGIL